MDFETFIWNYFMQTTRINNPAGVAGLMGNLQAESGLIPYRVQGDFTTGYVESVEYTDKVDKGTISKNDFIYNGPNGGGYGLAQWTTYSRKEGLYDKWKTGYTSIGNITLACDYLWHELQTGYTGVLSVLQTTTDIRTASNKVLFDFEAPADTGESVQNARYNNSVNIYNRHSDEPIVPPVDPSGRPLDIILLKHIVDKRKYM